MGADDVSRRVGVAGLAAALGRAPDAGEVAALRAGASVGAVVCRAEAGRVAARLEAAAPPLRCGPDMVAAPARGPMLAFAPVRMVLGSTQRAVHDGWQGRDAARLADVFDRMVAAALRRGEPAPFSHGQVAMARHYRDLSERHAAGGVRCASAEAGRACGAPGGGGGWIDAVIDTGRRLDALRARIGTGVAMEVRRVRPSVAGVRRAVRDRVLVDLVCLSDRSLDDVLRLHGWARKGETRAALRRALVGALDRMQGYGCARPQDGG